MNIHLSIITVFPELHDEWLNSSLFKKARERGQLTVDTVRLSDMVAVKERIDAPTCGPGPGMVLRAEVVSKAIDQAQAEHGTGKVVFFSPSGELLTQRIAQRFVHEWTGSDYVWTPNQVGGDDSTRYSEPPARHPELVSGSTSNLHLILVCSRYEGVDHRVEQEYADAIISIGNFVLMGGDLPAQVFAENILRFMPGILGNSDSVAEDSFTGPLVDHQPYGLPKEWRGREIPEVLLSGDHAKIADWREQQALKTTVQNHFEWVRSQHMDDALKKKVAATIPPHYVILMHDEVLVGKKEGLKKGVTSVTTIDLHDIARSSATYNIQKFFIVTPLHDQQRLLRVFFQFWQTAEGKEYNHTRHDAMSRVEVVSSIELAEQRISELNDGAQPLRVATSAKKYDGVPALTYDQQGVVWQHEQPVSLIFGTGQGLTNEFLQSCHYLLVPVYGFTRYNHLSVRSAVAIILDRWLAYRPV